MAKKPVPPKRPFGGKDSAPLEKSEARALRSGKMTPKMYVKGEKAEGGGPAPMSMLKRGQQLKSGKMTPTQYAKQGMRKK